MTTTPTIESVETDTALRKVTQLLQQHISGIGADSLGGDMANRDAADPEAVGLFIRDGARTVAAINSHRPVSFATGLTAAMPGQVATATELLIATRSLEHLAVAPSYRGRGYARALVAAAEERHRAAGGIDLWFGFVDDREGAALPMYEHLGFTSITDPGQLPGVASILGRSRVSRSGTWIYKNL
ncbi:GNAT superfamily N-acetyltransferase [Rhodococcus sp. PvR044]|uniref:GNAT family N-acetyltransferase n=1 Tax=Rhodococcus sp. PvR044 TaxID=3156402 RepID=UPI00339768B6